MRLSLVHPQASITQCKLLVLIYIPYSLYVCSASASRAEGTFKAHIRRETSSFWIALAFMIVKGIQHNMPPLFTSTETVVSSMQSTVNSLGEQLRNSLNISPPTSQTSFTSISRTSSSSSPHSASVSSSRISLSSTPTSRSSFSPISTIPPLISLSTRTEMLTSQTEPSPIIYSHVHNLRGIISSHYYPTSMAPVQNLARPLGDLAARYLASHGYGAEVVNPIIEAHGRVHSGEQLVTSLARRGMAVNEAKFLLVLINHDSTGETT